AQCMISPLFLAGLALLIVGLFASRFYNERALKLLSPPEKLLLLDSFSNLRVFGTVPLLFLFLSFFGIPYLSPGWMWPAYFGTWALLGVYFAILHRLIVRKLRALGINAEYVAAHNRARWMFYFGFLAFFILN